MKIWFLSIFENTPLDDNKNTRYNSLVEEATRRGHQVVYWASTFRHNVKKQRYDAYHVEQINDQVEVQFVPAKAYQNNISPQRLFSHLSLGKQMIKAFDEQAEKPAVMVVAFPPISTAFYAIQWAKKNGIPVVIDIIDPWPDAFTEHSHGLKKKVINAFLSPLRMRTQQVFQQASMVTAISNQYLNWAKTYAFIAKTACYYPAIQLEEMDRQLQLAAKSVHKPAEFQVIYAGSLGFSYDIPTILKAAELLEKSHPQVVFAIAGDGPQKELVEQYVQSHHNLVYHGRLSKDKLMEEYYKSSIGLTQHIKGATQSVTYKLFDLLGAGLPIINSLESEMKKIILDHEVGFHNDPGDAQALAQYIVQCAEDEALMQKMKNNARALTVVSGDSKSVYARALNDIESLIKN